MFAARDQENVVYTRPSAKGLAHAKSTTGLPGGGIQKTPFRSDDKPGLGQLKSKLAGTQNTTTPTANNRLPLGLRTTNVKTKNFQTPLPGKQRLQTLKGSSPRLRRPKIQVLQADEDVKMAPHEEKEEREIEYMAPNHLLRAALPDTPYDEFGLNRKFPQFEGDRVTQRWASMYQARGSHLPLKRDYDEQNEDEAANRCVQEALDRLTAVKKRLRSHPQPRTHSPQTSRPSQEPFSRYERLMQSTISSSARASSASNLVRNRSASAHRPEPVGHLSQAPISVPSSIPQITKTRPRHDGHNATLPAATTPLTSKNIPSSNMTIGYARGRATSAQLRTADSKTDGAGAVLARAPISRPPVSALNQKSRPLVLSSLARPESKPGLGFGDSARTVSTSIPSHRQRSASRGQACSNSSFAAASSGSMSTNYVARPPSVTNSTVARPQSNTRLSGTPLPMLFNPPANSLDGIEDNDLDMDYLSDQNEERALAHLLARSVCLEKDENGDDDDGSGDMGNQADHTLSWLDEEMEDFQIPAPV